jgi:hypothetical protein
VPVTRLGVFGFGILRLILVSRYLAATIGREDVELGGRWTFQHRSGNAYIESVRYPEAAVAYHETFMTGLATGCGFRDVIVTPPHGGGQTELVGRK